MSPTQSLQIIGFKKEVTANTFVAPTKFIPGTAQPNTTRTSTKPAQSRGTRSQVIDVITQLSEGIQVSFELIPEVVSELIAAWFGHGSDAISGSGAISHTLTPQPSLDTYSFEVDSDIYTQVLARQFAGNKIDQLALTYQASQLVTAQVTTVGTKEQTPATPGLPSNPTPALSTLVPMSFDLMAATLAGTATTQLISATLTCANQCQPVYASNNSLSPARVQETQRAITLSTTLDFLDTTFYELWATSEGSTGYVGAGGLVLSLVSNINIPTTSTPYKVQFTLPNLRPQDQYGLQAASDVLQQSMNWSITQGASADEISGLIVNSETGALA